jgi:hypothetical protein
MAAPKTSSTGNVYGPVMTHFIDGFNDVKLFLMQSARNPFVSLNLVFTLILTFASMEKFGRTGPADITYFTDMSFPSSAPPLNAAITTAIPVLPGVHLADATACLPGESEHSMYQLEGCFGGGLVIGRSGMLGSGYFGFEQNSFNVPHFLWVSSWFVTPIALFLVANAAWSVFNQWMWWCLYLFIMLWDVVGLVLMLMWHQSPLYNKIIAFVYFAFSALLMMSVRETWRVLSGAVVHDDYGEDVTLPMKSHHPVGIPGFMQGLSLGVGPTARTGETPGVVYVPVATDTVPTVLAHTFTRTVLILCEFFFLVPVVASTAFVMSQERAVPFDVQVRAWQASLLFGIVVVLEKARKTRLSYVTDTVLVMAAVVALSNVLYATIPELIWGLTNIRMGLSLSVMYICLSLMIFVAIVNVVVNMVYITFGGNNRQKMAEFQSTDVPVLGDESFSVPKTAYTRVVVMMYYFNVFALVVIKLLLMVVVMLGLLQNRHGSGAGDLGILTPLNAGVML